MDHTIVVVRSINPTFNPQDIQTRCSLFTKDSQFNSLNTLKPHQTHPLIASKNHQKRENQPSFQKPMSHKIYPFHQRERKRKPNHTNIETDIPVRRISSGKWWKRVLKSFTVNVWSSWGHPRNQGLMGPVRAWLLHKLLPWVETCKAGTLLNKSCTSFL